MFYTILPDKTEISIPQRRHMGNTSEKYDRVEDVFLKNQAMYKGQFGDATVRVC
jgi:aminoglycoside 3-N-acetyltransferase